MIGTPGHLANTPGLFPEPALPPSAAGLDLGVAAERVRAGGADPGVFRSALTAGFTADPTAPARRDLTLALAALAAWRAGLLSMRRDALARLDDLVTTAQGQLTAGAVLGLRPSVVMDFVSHQRADRWWWPGRAAARGYVLSAGGFSGLGGAWLRPPEEARLLTRAGAFAFLVDGEWWLLDCDVFCSSLRPVADSADDVGHARGREPNPPASSTTTATAAARALISPATHLAWIHVSECR